MNICTIDSLKKLKLNPNWTRVGILGYYKYNKKIYLLLGRYKVSDKLEELCAISGGYKRTKEQIEQGAEREFYEETEDFFNNHREQIKEDLLKAPVLFSTGKNGVDRILFLLNITKYLEGYPTNILNNMFQCHFRNRENTELAGIDLIEINKIVYDLTETPIYTDFISFMKKNKIYGNRKLEHIINNIEYCNIPY